MKKRFVSAFIAFIICISFVVPVGAVSGTGGGSSSIIQFSDDAAKTYFLERYNNLSFTTIQEQLALRDVNSSKFNDLDSILSSVIPLYFTIDGRSEIYLYYILLGHSVVYRNGSFYPLSGDDSLRVAHFYNSDYYRLNTTYQVRYVLDYPVSNTSTMYYSLPISTNNVPDFDDSKNDYYALGIDAIGFSEWLHEHPAFFDTLKKNFPNFHWDDDVATTKFLMQWWNAYGGRTDAMIENFQELVVLGLVDEDSIPLPPSPDYMWSLSSQIQKQYNKYNESLQTKPIPSDVQQPTVIDTPSIVAPSSNDSNDTSLLKEIIRLLVLQINQDSQNNSYIINGINDLMIPINNNIIPMMNNIVGGIGGVAGAINNINVKLGDYIDNLPSIPSVTDEEFWRMMLIPDFHDFDEFQDQFIEKFPVITQLDTVPDPDQILIGSGSAVQLASASSDDYEANEQFSFTAPETFANGAFSNIDIPIVDFSKFSLAIAAFKGIISVFALSIFSKWLFNFAPSLLNGR